MMLEGRTESTPMIRALLMKSSFIRRHSVNACQGSMLSQNLAPQLQRAVHLCLSSCGPKAGVIKCEMGASQVIVWQLQSERTMRHGSR